MIMKNRYYPQYFRAKRPYYNNAFVAEVYRHATDLRLPVVKFVRDTVLASAQRAGLPGSVNPQHYLHCESPIAQTLVTLEWFDTPLYDISPALLEALAHSDTGDMRLCDLRSPNHIYYLHWGPQHDLLLYGQIPVEGAVVAIVEHKWQLALVGRTSEDWPSSSSVRDSFMLKFPENAREVPFAQAVELAVAAGEQELRDVFAASQAGLNPWHMTQEIYESIHAEMEANAPVVKQALALAGNCMAYLTAYPGDSRFDWETDAPQSMLTKLTRGTKESERTSSKLKNLGYLQIHRVGLDFQQSVEAVEAAQRHSEGVGLPGAHASRRPHWRRGHWRHQAYGPQLSQRKLLWMRPTRVLGGPLMSRT